jgi:ubiquinone biosynthesis protein Coq4
LAHGVPRKTLLRACREPRQISVGWLTFANLRRAPDRLQDAEVPIKYRQALGAIASLVVDPFDYPAAQRLADALAHWEPMLRLYSKMVAHLAPGERERLRALTLEPLDLAALGRLPPDTFGHRFADYLQSRRLDPDAPLSAFPPIGPTLDEDWLLRRFVKTHDMLHLLTGFDVDIAGEMGLQLFNHRNFGEPYGLLALLSTPMVIARYGHARRTLAALRRGMRLAKSVDNLFCYPLEDLFTMNLEEARRRLGLAAARE